MTDDVRPTFAVQYLYFQVDSFIVKLLFNF